MKRLYVFFLFTSIIETTFSFLIKSPNHVSPVYSSLKNKEWDWSPEAWQDYPSQQIPTYENITILNEIKQEMKNYQPLVYAGEIRQLRNELVKVEEGESFIFQAGPCVETFQDDVNELRLLFQLMIQSSLIISFGLEKKVIRIGRIAGQFAKPRTQVFETGTDVLTYRGDIIHHYDASHRHPDPNRMKQAYFHAVMTLNSLRSFAKSGDLGLSTLPTWNTLPYTSTIQYQEFLRLFKKTMSFVMNSGILQDIHEPQFFISHEALLLHYEEVMTKQESSSLKWFNCGAHTIWLGERTRHSMAHKIYLQHLENPIGIKISSKADVNHIVELIKLLNPENERGKIMLIIRMGASQIRYTFPHLIQNIQQHGFNVIYICDPCHGNTKSIHDRKTRFLSTVHDEILSFFDICHQYCIVPGGVHLEISGSNVTECVGPSVHSSDLGKQYTSLVDPRLNAQQTLDTAFFIASIHRKLGFNDP